MACLYPFLYLLPPTPQAEAQATLSLILVQTKCGSSQQEHDIAWCGACRGREETLTANRNWHAFEGQFSQGQPTVLHEAGIQRIRMSLDGMNLCPYPQG